MRERLNAHNLGSTYPAGTLVGFQPPGQKPPPGVTHFRTADGSWNNLADPKEGAAGTRFLRNVDRSAIRPETDEQLLTPNPRQISRRLLTRPSDTDGRPAMTEVPFLNLLAASWIQFQNGDWITHGEILLERRRSRCRSPRTTRRAVATGRARCSSAGPSPTRRASVIGSRPPTTFINEVTHWWDGSQIYGSDQATQDRLRSGVDGKLRLNDDGTLPLDSNGVEDTGFSPQLVGGPGDAAHALRPRAQRHLRHPARGLPRLGRQPALQRRAAHQRRGDGQDPLHRMDARRSCPTPRSTSG